MQKYLLICVFVQLTICTSDLLAEETGVSDRQRQCVGAVQSDLPPPLQKIGMSNIKIRNISNRYPTIIQGVSNIYEFYYVVGEQLYQIEVLLAKKLEHFNSIEVGTERLNRVSDQVVLERLRHVLGELPVSAFQKNFSLYLFRRNMTYTNGTLTEIVGSTNGNMIILSPPLGLFTEDQYNFVETLNVIRHEIGRIINRDRKSSSFETWSISDSQRWKAAVFADGHSVFDYADGSIISVYNDTHLLQEDFAEAVRIYLESNGGLYHPELLDKFFNRFIALDEVMGITSDQRRWINERTYNYALPL